VEEEDIGKIILKEKENSEVVSRYILLDTME